MKKFRLPFTIGIGITAALEESSREQKGSLGADLRHIFRNCFLPSPLVLYDSQSEKVTELQAEIDEMVLSDFELRLYLLCRGEEVSRKKALPKSLISWCVHCVRVSLIRWSYIIKYAVMVTTRSLSGKLFHICCV